MLHYPFGLLPTCGVVHLLRVYWFARDAVRVTANVVGNHGEIRDVELSHNGLPRSRVFRYPIVRFCGNTGATHTVTLRDERPKADRADPDHIKLIYPNAHPDRARIAHWHARYAIPLFFVLPALSVLIFLLMVTIAHHARQFLNV